MSTLLQLILLIFASTYLNSAAFSCCLLVSRLFGSFSLRLETSHTVWWSNGRAGKPSAFHAYGGRVLTDGLPRRVMRQWVSLFIWEPQYFSVVMSFLTDLSVSPDKNPPIMLVRGRKELRSPSVYLLLFPSLCCLWWPLDSWAFFVSYYKNPTFECWGEGKEEK